MINTRESGTSRGTSIMESVNTAPSLDSLPTDEFLRVVGLRVRTQRAAMSMSRKKLAEVSGVSERYLAQLESGQGNMSIALLRKVTTAINMSLAKLLTAETPELHANGEEDAMAGSQREGSLQARFEPGTTSRDLAAGSNNRLVAEY